MLQSELLRHGELAWVTRGTFFGDQRNYLTVHIDDALIADDAWNAATHSTNYDPASAARMTAGDVAQAVAWSKANNIRLDMLFNGSGGTAGDPLLTAFTANASTFGWVSHTWDHPQFDCANPAFAASEFSQNTAFATANHLAVNPAEIVTGEHSGLANLVPGNPGTVDPPSLGSAAAATTGGTLATASYDYAVTDTNGSGETIPSVSSPVAVTGPTGSVALSWQAVCHAASYKVYRSVAGSNAWSLINTIAATAADFGDTGPKTLTYTDIGAIGTTATLPTTNTAVESPYAQSSDFAAALTTAGIKYFGSDASKPYPSDPLNIASTQLPAGTTFSDGGAQAVPRYPENIYYNAATQAQEVDEYNWLYTANTAPAGSPANGGCVASAVTTCETTVATFADIVNSASTNMFAHLMGNDPRPHYFHQTNLINTPTGTQDGVLYPVLTRCWPTTRATSTPPARPSSSSP